MSRAAGICRYLYNTFQDLFWLKSLRAAPTPHRAIRAKGAGALGGNGGHNHVAHQKERVIRILRSRPFRQKTEQPGAHPPECAVGTQNQCDPIPSIDGCHILHHDNGTFIAR